MKTLIAALAASSLAFPAMAATPGALPGIADTETTISGEITQYHFGKGDVLFVRDQTNRWFRVQLNEGCLKTPLARDTVVFERSDASSRLDTFSHVRFVRDGRLCRIDSIRRSEAPPQADSNSPVTGD